MRARESLVGLGLKSKHYAEVLERSPDDVCAQFFEVHAENLMGRGGAPLSGIEAVAERYPLSIHGTGLSLGSAGGLNKRHLARFSDLVARFSPMLVSEHLAWCRDGEVYYNDLLPLPLNDAALNQVADNLAEAQDCLGRQLLVENPSTYLAFRASVMEEPDFLLTLVERTGCGLLLDINNVFVSCSNLGTSAESYLRQIPASVVGEVHLAGHSIVPLSQTSDQMIRVDDHGSEVCDEVWDLLSGWLSWQDQSWQDQNALPPMLVEWDTQVPDFEVLLAQASLGACAAGFRGCKSALTHPIERSISSNMTRYYPQSTVQWGGDTGFSLSRIPTAQAPSQTMPESELARMQRAFGEALFGDSPEAALILLQNDDGAARDQLFVHRRNAQSSLLECLRRRYRRVAEVLGPDQFEALSLEFVRQHPPTDEALIYYGAGFAECLQEHADGAGPAWLPSLARLELGWHESYHERDATSVNAEELSQMDASRLGAIGFECHPTLRTFASDYDLLDVWDDPSRTPTPNPTTTACLMLVIRQNETPRLYRLQGFIRAIFECLASGGCAADAFLLSPNEDDFTQALAKLLSMGVFSRVII